MPPFETPSPPFRSSQLRTWADHVEPQMRNLLWGDYWQRFNTIQIPIRGESDYFDNAIEVAKLAQGKKAEFERIFEKRNAKRREELSSLLTCAAYQTIYNDKVFPCKDARDTVSDVCLTGCLWDFLRLLKGNAFGWEADAAEDAQLNSATSNISEETQTSADQLPDPCNKEIYNAYDQTQWPDDDYFYETPIERQDREEQSANATYYIGTFTYTQCATAVSNGIDVLAADKSVLERKAPSTHRKRKRNRCDDDASDARNHHRGISSIATSSIPHTSTENPTDRSATDDTSALDGIYKRRKIEAPSAQLGADEGTYKKRLGLDDDNDYEHRNKRQKLESPTACITSHASSSSSFLQQLEGENVAANKPRRKDNGSRGYNSRRRKKASFKPIRSQGSTNTRSVRRMGQSTFWELDHSGKPRSIIT